MKFKFFKNSVRPKPDFKTIEVEYKGERYGFLPNWFRRDGDNLVELNHEDVPDLLMDYKVDTAISFFERDIKSLVDDYRSKLKEKLSKLDDIIHEIENNNNATN